MADKVDKRWQTTGLGPYAEEALVGTLRHYGVETDRERFRTLAADQLPGDIAQEWMRSWKATGQFASFPLAAADELWHRWVPERPTPTQVAHRLAELVQRTEEGHALGDDFVAHLDALRATVPLREGRPDAQFVDDMMARLQEPVLAAFDAAAESLAARGLEEEARAVAVLEEFLLPEREGIATVLIDAALGNRQAALAKLEALAAKPPSTPEALLLTVDALMHLEANHEARAVAAPAFDAAEQAEDHHLALALGDRLVHLAELLEDREGAGELELRLQAVAEAHAAAHPHHG